MADVKLSAVELALAGAEKKLAESGAVQTFNVSALEYGAPAGKTDNIGIRVTTDQGKTVTFWKSNMSRVIENDPNSTEEGALRLIPGFQVAADGGVIPADAVNQGGYAKAQGW